MLDKVKNNEKVLKVRTHFRENKKVYAGIAAGTALGAGATVGTIYGLNLRAGQSVSIKQIFAWKSTMNNNIIQIMLPRAGHAGKVLVDKETGEYYMSINQLAKKLNVSKSMIQRYLAGEMDNLAGKQFELVLDGAPPITVSQLINPNG